MLPITRVLICFMKMKSKLELESDASSTSNEESESGQDFVQFRPLSLD